MMHKVDAAGLTDESQLFLPTSQVKLCWSVKLLTYACSFNCKVI